MNDGDARDPALDPRLAARFAAARVTLDAAALSRQALTAAAPALAARAEFWPRLVRVLGISLVPLPLLVAANLVGLVWLHGLLSAWLPGGVALYLIVSYALATSVALGLVYASIPLLLAWRPHAAAETAAT